MESAPYLCNGVNYVPWRDELSMNADKENGHEYVRLHGDRYCPICGREWFPCVGFISPDGDFEYKSR